MTRNFIELANVAIRNLTPYQPGKPIEEVQRELGLQDVIKLASNENPLGPSPKALTAIREALEKIHLYPDGNCYLLKHQLAEFLNVTPQQLTIGNGSENILEILAKAYLSPGDEVIVSQYAFATIPIILKAMGVKIITIPTKDWRHDIEATITACNANTRAIFIVNPNNPTGTYTTAQEYQQLLTKISPEILVVSDEAYCEFMDNEDYPNSLQLMQKYPNLVATRTFSKLYGLAGLRIGYSISSPEIADILNRARLPFNVNLLGVIAAGAALKDEAHVKNTLSLNQEGKQQLAEGLRALKISFIPSMGNFIAADMQRDANAIYQALLHKGIIVRPIASYGLPTYLRITIGTSAQNERLLQALAEVLK